MLFSRHIPWEPNYHSTIGWRRFPEPEICEIKICLEIVCWMQLARWELKRDIILHLPLLFILDLFHQSRHYNRMSVRRKDKFEQMMRLCWCGHTSHTNFCKKNRFVSHFTTNYRTNSQTFATELITYFQPTQIKSSLHYNLQGSHVHSLNNKTIQSQDSRQCYYTAIFSLVAA